MNVVASIDHCRQGTAWPGLGWHGAAGKARQGQAGLGKVRRGMAGQNTVIWHIYKLPPF